MTNRFSRCALLTSVLVATGCSSAGRGVVSASTFVHDSYEVSTTVGQAAVISDDPASPAEGKCQGSTAEEVATEFVVAAKMGRRADYLACTQAGLEADGWASALATADVQSVSAVERLPNVFLFTPTGAGGLGYAVGVAQGSDDRLYVVSVRAETHGEDAAPATPHPANK